MPSNFPDHNCPTTRTVRADNYFGHGQINILSAGNAHEEGIMASLTSMQNMRSKMAWALSSSMDSIRSVAEGHVFIVPSSALSAKEPGFTHAFWVSEGLKRGS